MITSSSLSLWFTVGTGPPALVLSHPVCPWSGFNPRKLLSPTEDRRGGTEGQ